MPLKNKETGEIESLLEVANLIDADLDEEEIMTSLLDKLNEEGEAITEDLTEDEREVWRMMSDMDWYLVDYKDGTTDLVHETSLSNILQVGKDPADYGILQMDRCGSNRLYKV